MDQAIAISSSIEQITKIAGPALGGLLVAVFGVSVCYVIDSATYLVSALILLAVPRAGRFRTARETAADTNLKERHSFRREATAGLRLIAAMPAVLSGAVMLVSSLMVLTIADSQTVTLFRDIPGVSGELLGWCVAASGFGTLLSALTVGRKGSGKHPLLLMSAGAMLMGSVFAGAALVTAHGEAGIGMNVILFSSFTLAGAGAGLVFIPFNAMLQKRTPEAYTGRVFGTVNSLTSAAVILGPVAGGALVTTAGAVTAFMISGVLAVLLGLTMLLLRARIENKDEVVLRGRQESVASNI